jgi:hypothetical protein
MLELELDAGESIRTLKLNISRAAKEVDRTVDYGVSDEGTLLVWVQEKPKQKRGPRKARHANTEGEAPTGASADVR